MLRLVSWVLALLWVAEDESVEFVTLVLVVCVRFSLSRPSSYADFLVLRSWRPWCERNERWPADSLLESLPEVIGRDWPNCEPLSGTVGGCPLYDDCDR